jgi:hypothetical protein
MKPVGVYVEHRFRKSDWLYLVMVWKKPFVRSDGTKVSRFCPLCQTLHFTKTVHLDLVEGRAIVSSGVLEELKMAGLPDLDIVGTTAVPPGLKVGDAGSRVEQNQTNRQIKVWKPYKPKKGVPVNANT